MINIGQFNYIGEFEATNDGSLRGDRNQFNMLLNSDFCLTWELELDEDGVSHCTIRAGGRNPGINGNCAQSSTHDLGAHYADNNADWVADFTDVFMKMISRNGDNTDLKLISELDQSKDQLISGQLLEDNYNKQEIIDHILKELEIE